ncbi:MAG: Crp/Fnr family transcriptional regulator [Roseovarius pacificus]|nr:Crp/Fnr family transcriptional regulator [Roseovarius pacificus]
MRQDLSVAADKCPVLSRVSRSRRQELVSQARIQTYEAGQTLYMHDMPADRCFVLLDGWVKLYRVRRDGEEAVIRVQAKGETLGVNDAMRDGRYGHYASAVAPSRAIVFPAKVMRRTLKVDTQFGEVLLHHLFEVNDQLHDHIETLKSMSAIERVASFLQVHARTQPDETAFTLPFDQVTLARYLGIQPESLSRALRNLSGYGVRATRSRIEITDIAALNALTQSSDDETH